MPNATMSYEPATVSYEPSELYVHSMLEQRHRVPAGRSMPSFPDAHREIAVLRLLNAHLIREVARLRQREAQAQRLAERDALTGVYNRRRMLERLEMAIVEAARERHGVGVLFIDLDGFKGINDEFGHAVGDKILIAVGARIAARTRTDDIVCRYGGDEFVVLLPRLSDVGDTIRVSEMIRRRLAAPYCIDGRSLRLTAAIGAAVYPRDGDSAQVLLHGADASMYRAKSFCGRPQSLDAEPSAQRPSRRRKATLGRPADGDPGTGALSC